MTDLRPLLSVSDVALVVGMSDHTIRQAIREGQLHAVKLRGRIRIDPEDVRGWIEASAVVPLGRPGRGPAIVVDVPQMAASATAENFDALMAASLRRAA